MRNARRIVGSGRLLRGFGSQTVAGRRARTRMSNLHEEEALGKAYDSPLMRRLLRYMKPYKWRVVLALLMVAIVTPLELAPPLIFRKAIDSYFTPALKHVISETSAWMGIGWLSLLFFAVLSFAFFAQYIPIC